MSIEAAEILAGLWAGLVRIADGLTVHLRDVDAGVAVLVSVFLGVLCGAWFVQFLERLAQVPLMGWLRGAAAAVAVGIQRLVRVPRLRHADQGAVPALP